MPLAWANSWPNILICVIAQGASLTKPNPAFFGTWLFLVRVQISEFHFCTSGQQCLIFLKTDSTITKGYDGEMKMENKRLANYENETCS